MTHSTVLRLSDPFEHAESVHNGDVKLLATSRGDYRATLTRIGLHRLFMQRGWEALPFVVNAKLNDKRRPIFFLDDASQGDFFQSGRQITDGDIVFLSPGAEYHQRTTGASQWGAMSLSAEDLAAAGHAIAGRDLTAPSATRIMRIPPHLLARLRALHRAAGQLAETAPDILAHPEVARAMEQALVHAMVRCLTEGSTTGSDALTHRRVTVMRRFEQVLEETGNRPLYMAEFCSAVGVPERTLRAHCMEHLGMTPHRYLWLRRMHQTWRALSLAAPAATTVTAIAADRGFWEFGRFAGAYRDLFGELPSVTLRRAPALPAEQPQAELAGMLPILHSHC